MVQVCKVVIRVAKLKEISRTMETKAIVVVEDTSIEAEVATEEEEISNKTEEEIKATTRVITTRAGNTTTMAP